MIPRDREDIPADLASLVRLGAIQSVDLDAARCVVRYGDPDDPDGPAETPPIRWLAPRAGLTRVWSPPSVGEQVLLLAPDGQIGAAVALLGMVQDAFPAAGNTTAEVVEFGDGARIAYDPETSRLSAVLPAGGSAEIVAPGGMTLRGDVTIEGDVAVSGRVTAADDVIAGDISLTAHRHGQVASGGSKTGAPE